MCTPIVSIFFPLLNVSVSLGMIVSIANGQMRGQIWFLSPFKCFVCAKTIAKSHAIPPLIIINATSVNGSRAVGCCCHHHCGCLLFVENRLALVQNWMSKCWTWSLIIFPFSIHCCSQSFICWFDQCWDCNWSLYCMLKMCRKIGFHKQKDTQFQIWKLSIEKFMLLIEECEEIRVQRCWSVVMLTLKIILWNYRISSKSRISSFASVEFFSCSFKYQHYKTYSIKTEMKLSIKKILWISRGFWNKTVLYFPINFIHNFRWISHQ